MISLNPSAAASEMKVVEDNATRCGLFPHQDACALCLLVLRKTGHGSLLVGIGRCPHSGRRYRESYGSRLVLDVMERRSSINGRD